MSDNLNIKFCNGCGEKIPFDAKYCTKCGFKQIRIAENKDYISNVNNSIDYDSQNKLDAKNQIEKSKSNIGIILIIGLVIVGFLFYLFFQNYKTNDKILAVAADSVAVDTTSAYAYNVPVDTTSSIVTNDSVLVALKSDNGLNNENNSSTDEDNIGRKLLTRFSQLNNEGNYENFEEIFGAKIEFHNLKDATIAQVKADIINYKRKWSIVSENLVSVELVSTQEYFDLYHYEKELQLKRNPDNGNLYNYKISGEMLIDKESSKIVSLKDLKTIKVNQ